MNEEAETPLPDAFQTRIEVNLVEYTRLKILEIAVSNPIFLNEIREHYWALGRGPECFYFPHQFAEKRKTIEEVLTALNKSVLRPDSVSFPD